MADRLGGLFRGLVAVAAVAGLLGLVLADRDDTERSAYRSLPASAPVRLEIPSIGVDAPVVPIEVDSDAVLNPPGDPVQVGWWKRSAQPGARGGQTVIAGHTVHTGGGSLDHVRSLRKGQTVDLATHRGTMRYRVRSVQVYDQPELADHADELFGQGAGDGRLVIVSCTDWNGSSYDNNVVVLAQPLGQPRNKGESKGAQQAAGR